MMPSSSPMCLSTNPKEFVPGTPLQGNARSEVHEHPSQSYRTPPRDPRRQRLNFTPPSGNDYPSQSYHTPRPSPRKRSKNVTNSNPSPKKKSRNANNSCDVGSNVPDSIGGDSEVNAASSPLDHVGKSMVDFIHMYCYCEQD